jgi:hypothetical protein
MTTALKLINRTGTLDIHLECLRQNYNTLLGAMFVTIDEGPKGSARQKNFQPGESFVFAHLPCLYRWTSFELAKPAFESEVREYIRTWSAPRSGAGTQRGGPSCFDCVVCKVSLPKGGELLHGSKYYQFYSATIFKLKPRDIKGVQIPIPHRCELCRHLECLKTLEVSD